jgi:Ran-binding protein 3
MKLNITRVHSDDEDDSPDSDDSNDAEASASSRKARFILRSDGSHRVVLNTPFTKTMTLGGGDAAGERPTGSVLLFHGFLEGQEKPSMLQVKVCLSVFFHCLDDNLELTQILPDESCQCNSHVGGGR